MKLTILERLMILNVMPDVGNVATMRMRQHLIEKAGLTAEEMEEAKVATGEDGTLRWEKEFDKDIEFKPAEHALISEALERLSNDKKLQPEQLTLYDKFVGG